MIKPPEQLSGYEQDLDLQGNIRRMTKILGWASIAALVATIASFVFLEPKGVGAGVFVLFLVMTTVYAKIRNKKREVLCSGCGKEMETLDCPWAFEDWKVEGKITAGMIEGGDGLVYNTGTIGGQHGTGGNVRHVIYARKQRWYYCKACNLCALGEPDLMVSVFAQSSRGPDGKQRWEDAKQFLKTNDNPVQDGRLQL